MKVDENAKTQYQQYFSSDEHQILRQTVRTFVNKQIVPYIDEWEEAGEFPKELYKTAGDLGFLGVGYPEELGGTPGDIFFYNYCN